MLVHTTTEQLAQTLRGQLILPGDPEYDAARTVWNGMIDRRPALIARCAGVADVQAAVNFVREQKLPVTVKGGGHSVAGKAVKDNAMMIDVSPMNTVAIDPATRTARVGAGATWRDVDGAAQAHGLATTGGTVSPTGVAGLTLGGGIGHLARKHGLTIDNLLAVELVTADGKVRRASAEQNPELFWALRGGGGGVGVVTTFEFQLHEVGPDVLVAQSFHPLADARTILTFYRDFMRNAPNELACYAFIIRVPPLAPFPADHHGQIAVALVACYIGEIAEGETVLAPLQQLRDPILNFCQPMPYIALQQNFDAGAPDGGRYYWKSQFLDELSDAAIETMIEQAEPLPGPFTMVGIEPMGGAIAAVEPSATAYPQRQAVYNFSVFAGWQTPEDDNAIMAWTRQFHSAMSVHTHGGAYINYLDRDDEARTRHAYGENYARLLAVKQAWDPDGVFSTG